MAATSTWPAYCSRPCAPTRSPNGKKFLSEFKSLHENKHRRIIKGLAHAAIFSRQPRH